MHPLIVHFPIVLLMLVPLFVLAAVKLRWRRVMLGAAIVLAIAAVASTYVALETGEAGAEIADRTPVINHAIHEHEEAAEAVMTVFAILTALLIALAITMRLLSGRFRRRRFAPLLIGYAVIHLACYVLVARAAHLGGELVHVHGVHALVQASPPADEVEDNDSGRGRGRGRGDD